MGGSIVERGTWPWIVRLSMGCGGSIIHPEYIITAAHCCEGRSASQIGVSVGEWNRAGSDIGEFSVTATQKWEHEQYGAVNGISYDVCLLKVPNLNTAQPDSCKTAVNNGPCWSPVCLPAMNAHAAPGRHCWVAGWGALSQSCKCLAFWVKSHFGLKSNFYKKQHQRLNFWSKMEILTKNGNFDQKYKFWSYISKFWS